MTNKATKSNGPNINWHEGPARNGEGSFGKDAKGRSLWGDGDRLLIAVELRGGGIDVAKVLISADEESFAVLIDDGSGDEYSDWSPDDWSWWAKDYDEKGGKEDIKLALRRWEESEK